MSTQPAVCCTNLEDLRTKVDSHGESIARLEERDGARKETLDEIKKRVNFIVYGVIVVLLNVAKEILLLLWAKKAGG